MARSGIFGTVSWAGIEDSPKGKSFGVVLDECWEDFQRFMNIVWGRSKILGFCVSATLLAFGVFVGRIFILLINMFFVFPHP